LIGGKLWTGICTRSSLRAWQRWEDREPRADAFITFALDPDGRVAHARMRAMPPAPDFSFDFRICCWSRSRSDR
jgi:hypothetical protein